MEERELKREEEFGRGNMGKVCFMMRRDGMSDKCLLAQLTISVKLRRGILGWNIFTSAISGWIMKSK